MERESAVEAKEMSDKEGERKAGGRGRENERDLAFSFVFFFFFSGAIPPKLLSLRSICSFRRHLSST